MHFLEVRRTWTAAPLNTMSGDRNDPSAAVHAKTTVDFSLSPLIP